MVDRDSMRGGCYIKLMEESSKNTIPDAGHCAGDHGDGDGDGDGDGGNGDGGDGDGGGDDDWNKGVDGMQAVWEICFIL